MPSLPPIFALLDGMSQREQRAQERRDRERRELGEAMLVEWGEWCRYKLLGQGFGGGSDHLGERQPRAPGVHSDPVLAEVLATREDGQDRPQRVHDCLRRYTRDWQRVARLRWVGRQEVRETRVEMRTQRVTTAGAAHRIVRRSVKVPASFQWATLTWEEIAAETGWGLRTCERIGENIRLLLAQDVLSLEAFCARAGGRE